MGSKFFIQDRILPLMATILTEAMKGLIMIAGLLGMAWIISIILRSQ